MNSYIITFSFSDKPECRDNKDNVIEFVNSYKYSTKLFDNTYQVFSTQDLPEIYSAISERLAPDDKMIIAQSVLFRGKNTPNI